LQTVTLFGQLTAPEGQVIEQLPSLMVQVSWQVAVALQSMVQAPSSPLHSTMHVAPPWQVTVTSPSPPPVASRWH
jgi:hypothetical protein